MDKSVLKPLRLMFILAMSAVIISPALHAAEQRPATVNTALEKPLVITTVRPGIAKPANTTVDVIDVHTNPAIDLLDPMCAELNQIAVQEGNNAIHNCRDEINNTPVADSTANTPEIDVDSVDTTDEPVIFVHGFSATAVVAGHNCEQDYWGAQKKKIKDLGREAKTIGWYTNNTDCDVDLYTHGENGNYSSNTPIEVVAEDLFHHIRDTYIDNGGIPQSIDIVAHSLGGLVVRKMLDDWGDQLYVTDVVTLATPHDGVKASFIGLVCWLWEQCTQSFSDSDFMNDLEHNPQSLIDTKWTLIAAADDQTIGQNTATRMNRDSPSKPAPSKYTYKSNHKHSCGWSSPALGHGDVHGKNGTKAVYVCDGWYYSGDTVKRPTNRMLDALN